MAAEPTAADRVAAPIQRCRAIAEDAVRLSCFDKAAVWFASAIASSDIRIIDKQEVRRARRSLFGFSLPRIGLFSDAEAADDEKADSREIDTAIAASTLIGNDIYDLRMVDGSVWRISDALQRNPKPGAGVHITKATLGSYFLKVERSRPIRGIRIK